MKGVPHNQRGASVFGMLVGLLLLAILVTFGIKLVPMYLDDVTIKESLKNLDRAHQVVDKPPREIRSMIQKSFSVNDVTAVKPDEIEIERKDGVLILSVEYEQRSDLFRNIDVVTSFSHRYEVTGRSQ